MTPDSILARLAARGVTLTAEGDRLHYRGRLTPADRETLSQHKTQLLEVLRRRPVTLPPVVEGLTLEDLRLEAGDDWPELASNPELLRAFARSCRDSWTLRPRARTEADEGRWVTPCLAPPPCKVLRQLRQDQRV